MHASSLENMQRVVERYVWPHRWRDPSNITVLDIGGADVNGTYADIFGGAPYHYTAADIDAGDGIAMVLDDPYRLPVEDGSVDLVISGQVFEHVEFFWLLFEEMVRVVHPDGLIALIAPSSGPIHRYPVDCYRYYPDSYRALAKYTSCHAVDVYHDRRGPWDDLVGVFSRTAIEPYRYAGTRSRPAAFPASRHDREIEPQAPPERATPEEEATTGAAPYREVLERLHREFAPRGYLEIGVRSGASLKLASAPTVGVDPAPDRDAVPADGRVVTATSDDFFEFSATEVLDGLTVDLAFIDGLHLFEFAFRDFMNVEAVSNLCSVVVVDDAFPNHPRQAERERSTAVWTGDVWRVAFCLRAERNDLALIPVDTSPSGLLLVVGLDPQSQRLRQRYNPAVKAARDLDLEQMGASWIAREPAVAPDDERLWELLARVRDVRELPQAAQRRQVRRLVAEAKRSGLAW